jgi:hypothetical protein
MSNTPEKQHLWRMPGERYADCCVTEHDRFGGGSVMVWAGISIDRFHNLEMTLWETLKCPATVL